LVSDKGETFHFLKAFFTNIEIEFSNGLALPLTVLEAALHHRLTSLGLNSETN
jgi:hypothetical protein